MTIREIQIEFERLIQAGNSDAVVDQKVNSDTLFAFLNFGVDKFYKTRYSGINPKGKGFEQDQKRISDLISLVTVSRLHPKENKSMYKNGWYCELPDYCTLVLGEDVTITSTNKCWELDENGNPIEKIVDVIECTQDNITSRLNNSLSEHRLHNNNARPLRIFAENIVLLVTDGNYDIVEYRITYLRTPLPINKKWDGDNIVNIELKDYNNEYTELPAHTHHEIVNLAYEYFLSCKGNPNLLNSFSSEVNKME